MISLNNNIQSLRSATQFNSISSSIEKITQQISTGKRIVSAADDPSGVGILSNLHAQDASYNAVKKNISAGLSLLKTS
jgi:flagellin